MDRRLLDILVCPICKGSLKLAKLAQSDPAMPEAELICERDRLAFPIRDDIPVMLVDEARQTNVTRPPVAG